MFLDVSGPSKKKCLRWEELPVNTKLYRYTRGGMDRFPETRRPSRLRCPEFGNGDIVEMEKKEQKYNQRSILGTISLVSCKF